ncbi:MAG TPA: histidine phosphatase family protein, partial [Isosphaeraceae bacterium]
MRQLYLLRHGIAVPHGTPGIEDDQRPLTPRGERRMKEIARGLRALGLELDRIVTSPLPRALRTAEIVAKVLKCEEVLEEADALGVSRDAASIRDWIGTRPEPRLMLVGLDPWISELVGLLVTGAADPPYCELRKGGIAALRDHPDGGLRLDWLAR